MVRCLRSAGPVFWELKLCAGEWSLGWVESGSCQTGLAGRTVEIRAPALVWFPPETVHECRPTRGEVPQQVPPELLDRGFGTSTQPPAAFLGA